MRCPTPSKQQWPSQDTAQGFVNTAKRIRSTIGDRRRKTECRAYLCPSGKHWHVTSQPQQQLDPEAAAQLLARVRAEAWEKHGALLVNRFRWTPRAAEWFIWTWQPGRVAPVFRALQEFADLHPDVEHLSGLWCRLNRREAGQPHETVAGWVRAEFGSAGSSLSRSERTRIAKRVESARAMSAQAEREAEAS